MGGEGWGKESEERAGKIENPTRREYGALFRKQLKQAKKTKTKSWWALRKS